MKKFLFVLLIISGSFGKNIESCSKKIYINNFKNLTLKDTSGICYLNKEYLYVYRGYEGSLTLTGNFCNCLNKKDYEIIYDDKIKNFKSNKEKLTIRILND